MHIYTDTCTPSHQSVEPDKGCMGHAYRATQGYMCLWETMQRGEEYLGMQVTCIHVLMHAHLLTKVWSQIKGGWNMQTGPTKGAHV